MILDAQLMFSDSQAVAADAASTNLVDLTTARQIAEGEPMAVVMTVDTAADTTTGDETYTFNVQTDGDVAFGTPVTLSTVAIAGASLTAGSKHILSIPQSAVERYIRLYYDVAGTTPSVTVTAFLAPLSMVGSFRAYPDNITITG